MAISFTPNTPGPPLVEVGQVDEGSFVDGRWVQGMSYVDHRTGANDLPLLLPAAFHRPQCAQRAQYPPRQAVPARIGFVEEKAAPAA